MIKLARIFTLVALVVVPLTAAGSADGSATYMARLHGTDEMPTNTGDPDGKGFLPITLYMKSKRVCWSVTYQNIDTATSATVRFGQPGSEGPVVLTLFQGTQVPSGQSGCASAPKSEMRKIRRGKYTDYYVDLSTNAYPNGAIRGQLS